MSSFGKFILDEHGEPVPETDLLTWARWYEQSGKQRRVALTDMGLAGSVSTIFLGLDRSFSPMNDPLIYKPVLWETMVFSGPKNGSTCRYTSRTEAFEGHEAMVALCRLAYEKWNPENADETQVAIALERIAANSGEKGEI